MTILRAIGSAFLIFAICALFAKCFVWFFDNPPLFKPLFLMALFFFTALLAGYIDDNE